MSLALFSRVTVQGFRTSVHPGRAMLGEEWLFLVSISVFIELSNSYISEWCYAFTCYYHIWPGRFLKLLLSFVFSIVNLTSVRLCAWAWFFCFNRRPTAFHDRGRDSDDDDYQNRDYDVAALANNLSQAFRYGIYSNDDADEVRYRTLLSSSIGLHS